MEITAAASAIWLPRPGQERCTCVPGAACAAMASKLASSSCGPVTTMFSYPAGARMATAARSSSWPSDPPPAVVSTNGLGSIGSPWSLTRRSLAR